MPNVVSNLYSFASGCIKGATDTAKWGAVSLIENGKGENIDCYSSSCVAGKVCYVPTCPRGKNVKLLSKEAIQDIVMGLYQGVGERAGFLSAVS